MIAASLILAGCNGEVVVQNPPPPAYYPPGPYYPYGPPPAAIVETYGPAPYPGAIWIHGSWGWHRGHHRWVWHRGHWR